MGSYWRSTRALRSYSLWVDICNCCFVLLGEINDDDDDVFEDNCMGLGLVLYSSPWLGATTRQLHVYRVRIILRAEWPQLRNPGLCFGSKLDRLASANFVSEDRRPQTLTPVRSTRVWPYMHSTRVFIVQSLTSSVQCLLGLPRALLPSISPCRIDVDKVFRPD